MLRACPQCQQFIKPDEKTCPHCGRESGWRQVVASVAAAAVLGSGCQKAGPPDVPAPLYGAPPPVSRPLYGRPPAVKPPEPPDAGVPEAPKPPPPDPAMRPLYGVVRPELPPSPKKPTK